MSQQNQNIKLRLGQKDDAGKIFNLHRRAIHEIASNDYPPEIINAWGRKFSPEELHRKQEKFEAYLKEGNIVVIAEINEVLAGFGEVMPLQNELVAVYVNPDFKR